MATGNAINANSTGLVKYDGAGTFSGVTVTQYDVLVGDASNGIVSVAPSATSGVPLVSAGSSANPAFGTAVVAGGGTGATSFTANGVVISNTTSTGALAALALSSGQLVIGGTTTPAAATLTAGTGISISNGNNSITINSTGGGVTWTDVTGTTQTLAVECGYLADNAGLVTMTLPATASQFATITVCGYAAGGWKIAQNAGQSIQLGSATATTTGAGGYIASTNRYDCVKLLAVVGGSSTVWLVINAIGNITIV